MLNRILTILAISLIAGGGARAANECDTLPECRQLKNEYEGFLQKVEARILALQPSPQFGDIVRNANKSVRTFVQSSEYIKSIGGPVPNGELGALEYCASHGMHLPSARELAQLASRQCTSDIAGKEPCGAAGISETAKDGYYQLNAQNADGQSDIFYFSYAGYKRPAGDLGNHSFWSSSVFPNNSSRAFFLSGDHGYVDYDLYQNYYFYYAVRCVAGR